MTENTVEVDEETYVLLAERAEEKDFDTTDEYINYVLDQVADKVRKKREESDQEFSEEDEKKVKKRLKGLGYLD